METVYQTLSNTFAEMSKYAAMLDAPADAAAAKAAANPAESQPPAVDAGAAGGATGVLATTTSLRRDSAPSREAPYAARAVIARPAKTAQSASSDVAGTAVQAEQLEPPRERSEAELLDSVSKILCSTPANDMDQ